MPERGALYGATWPYMVALSNSHCGVKRLTQTTFASRSRAEKIRGIIHHHSKASESGIFDTGWWNDMNKHFAFRLLDVSWKGFATSYQTSIFLSTSLCWTQRCTITQGNWKWTRINEKINNQQARSSIKNGLCVSVCGSIVYNNDLVLVLTEKWAIS